jgi:hypothetical protein
VDNPRGLPFPPLLLDGPLEQVHHLHPLIHGSCGASSGSCPQTERFLSTNGTVLVREWNGSCPRTGRG